MCWGASFGGFFSKKKADGRACVGGGLGLEKKVGMGVSNGSLGRQEAVKIDNYRRSDNGCSRTFLRSSTWNWFFQVKLRCYRVGSRGIEAVMVKIRSSITFYHS